MFVKFWLLCYRIERNAWCSCNMKAVRIFRCSRI